MEQRVKERKTLSSLLSLGVVELNVEDLTEMTDFYHTVLGLDIISSDEKKVSLGKHKTSLLVLHQSKGLPQSHPTHAGLYHFAILFSSRGDLSRTVFRILNQRPDFFSGSADHLVSEAFYFNDPEGNGIELYYDRDRSLWQWENNQVKMATLYIDPVDYLQKYIVLEEPNTEVKMGHFHLKVGNIEEARSFYVDILGFDVTAQLPGALFISVGGYHHHIGLNTWESSGASRRGDSLGLKSLEFFLPDKEDVTVLKEKLHTNKIEFIEENNSLIFHDPWNNEIHISLR